MNKNADSLIAKTKAILNTHGYDKQCIPLEDVAAAIDDTHHSISRKVFFYKWSGLGFLLLIPVLSTLLSLLVTEPVSAGLIKPFSYLLTFLTLLNSILKPRDRFKQACTMGIGIERVSGDFLVKLDRLARPVEEKHLDEITDKFSGKLAPYKEQLIDLFLPEVPAEPSGRAPVSGEEIKGGESPEDLKKSAHA